jgi:hypothetical protein
MEKGLKKKKKKKRSRIWSDEDLRGFVNKRGEATRQGGKKLTTIVIIPGPSRTRVIGIIAANRRRPSHVFVNGASRSSRVIAALVDIIRPGGIVALNFLDRVVACTRKGFSFVARIAPRRVIIVITSVTRGRATVARIATILVIRHEEGRK